MHHKHFCNARKKRHTCTHTRWDYLNMRRFLFGFHLKFVTHFHIFVGKIFIYHTFCLSSNHKICYFFFPVVVYISHIRCECTIFWLSMKCNANVFPLSNFNLLSVLNTLSASLPLKSREFSSHYNKHQFCRQQFFFYWCSNTSCMFTWFALELQSVWLRFKSKVPSSNALSIPNEWKRCNCNRIQNERKTSTTPTTPTTEQIVSGQ